MWVEELNLTLMILGHHNGEMAGQMETLAAIMPTSSTVSLFSDSLGKDSCSQYIDEEKKAQNCQWSGQRQLVTDSDSPSFLSSSLWLTPAPCHPQLKQREFLLVSLICLHSHCSKLSVLHSRLAAAAEWVQSRHWNSFKVKKPCLYQSGKTSEHIPLLSDDAWPLEPLCHSFIKFQFKGLLCARWGFPSSADGKASACCRGPGFNP